MYLQHVFNFQLVRPAELFYSLSSSSKWLQDVVFESALTDYLLVTIKVPPLLDLEGMPRDPSL
jgi:hypothetical protein